MIPASVEVINEYAFTHRWCESSQSKHLVFADDANIQIIGSEAFFGTALQGVLKLPESMILVESLVGVLGPIEGRGGLRKCSFYTPFSGEHFRVHSLQMFFLYPLFGSKFAGPPPSPGVASTEVC